MSALQTVLGKFSRSLRLMIGRCVLTAIDDSTKMQLVDISAHSRMKRSKLEHFQPYGFTSRPLPGAEGIVAYAGGSPDHGLVLVVSDRRYRFMPLQEGGCALHDQDGNSVEIRPDDGEVRVTALEKVTITAPENVINGPLTVTGFAHFEGSVEVDDGLQAQEVTSVAADLNMSQVKNRYNSHTHPGGGAPNPQM